MTRIELTTQLMKQFPLVADAFPSTLDAVVHNAIASCTDNTTAYVDISTIIALAAAEKALRDLALDSPA